MEEIPTLNVMVPVDGGDTNPTVMVPANGRDTNLNCDGSY